MIFNKHTLFSTLILGSILATTYKVAGASRMSSQDIEFQRSQAQQLHLQPSKQSAGGLTKSQQSNNEADIETLYQLPPGFRQHLARLQRSTAAQAATLPAQSTSQQILEQDELAMKRQMPDMIAQARNDKNVERALLKMLISASLRSAPNDLSQMSAIRYRDNGRPDVLQEVAAAELDGDSNGGDGSFRIPARLAQMIDEYAGLNTLNNESGQPAQYPQVERYPNVPMLDKRDMKPCYFNALACASHTRKWR